MHEQIPFGQLIEPDPRNLGLVGPVTTDALQELINEAQVRSEVPEDVRKQFSVAEKLFVYGYFVYEFYTVASFISVLAVESALIHKFGRYYDQHFELKKRGKVKNAVNYDGVRTLLRKGWQLVDDPDFKSGLKSLILWAGRKKLIENSSSYADSLPSIRASHAHPLFQQILTIGMAHGVIVKTTELINELFEDKQHSS